MAARLLLAPMAGVTDWPLRVLCYRMGADYACTEMVSAMGYLCAKPGNEAYRRLLRVHPEEAGRTAVQLFGRDPDTMAEAARRVTALNRFESVDINMGCPARKIVSGGEGSALLTNPDLAYRIMAAVKAATNLPVTVKTRLGYDREGGALELGRAAQALGLRWLCVHGRTRAQQYGGQADWAAIARLREALSIPVVANGDLLTPANAPRMRDQTGCDRLMIGRGAMGNPWLFRDARAALEGREPTPVTTDERVNMALTQAEWMVESKGERIGISEMRTHVGHYVAGIRGAAAFRRRLNAASTLAELRALLEELRVEAGGARA